MVLENDAMYFRDAHKSQSSSGARYLVNLIFGAKSQHKLFTLSIETSLTRPQLTTSSIGCYVRGLKRIGPQY